MLITLRGQRVNRRQKNESCITSMMLTKERLRRKKMIVKSKFLAKGLLRISNKRTVF